MVVKQGKLAGWRNLCLIAMAAALAAVTGCASPLLKSAGETELPLAESQTPKVYSKATPPRTTNAVQPRSAPPAVDQRMQQELERLTRLNDQLSKTLRQPATAAPKPKEDPNRNAQRKATQDAIGQGMRSEFVEPAAAKEQAKGAEAASFSFSDGSDAAAEQAPAPVVEKKTPSEEVKLVSPKQAESTEKPPASKEEKESTYQAGDWLKSREQLIVQLQAEIALAKLDKTRTAEVSHLETLVRMHHALAGRRDDAVQPIPELREHEQEFWRSEALGLADLLSNDRLASESRRFAVALKSLEEAESHLAAASSLTLRNIALCRKVQDFGVVERFKALDFKPNQEVLLYVEVRNFTAQRKDNQAYETELQGSFRILDGSGTARAERILPLDKQTCANLRRDYYIAYRLYIPSELTPGAYTLELTIEDKKGNKSNNALLDLNVVQ